MVEVLFSDPVEVVLVVEDSVGEEVEDPVVGEVVVAGGVEVVVAGGVDVVGGTGVWARLRLLSWAACAELTLTQRPTCRWEVRWV